MEYMERFFGMFRDLYFTKNSLFGLYLGKICRDIFLLIIIGDWKIRLSSKIKKSSISVFKSRNLLCIRKYISIIIYSWKKLLTQILMSYLSKEFSFSEDKNIHDLQIATS